MSEERGAVRNRIVLGVLLVLIAGVLGWQWLQRQRDKVVPHVTRSTDFILPWRCLACGNEQEAQAAPGPKPCPKCSKNEYYVNIPFICSKHGTFRVAYNYDDQGKPSQVKVGDGPWVPYLDPDKGVGTVCPKCGTAMLAQAALKKVGAEDEGPEPGP